MSTSADSLAPSSLALRTVGSYSPNPNNVHTKFVLMNHSFKLAALKLCSPSKEHLEQHYADLSSKPFFPGLVSCKHLAMNVAKILYGDTDIYI